MATAIFDTLHAAKALTQAGFATPQAEAITDTIREAFTESVATKTDVAELRADIAELETRVTTDIAGLKANFAELETRVTTDIASLKANFAELETRVTTDIAGLKANMASLEARMAERFEGLYKQLWLVALGIVTAIAAIVKLL